MKNMMKKNQVGSVLVLLVFAVFVVSVLLVLLTGADVVQKLNERDRRSYDHRTIVQYLTTRVRQADEQGCIAVREQEDRSVLVLMEDIEGICYETLVYCYDGYLCELFVEAGTEMDLEFGEWILPMQALVCEDRETHLVFDLTMNNGDQQQMLLARRSQRGSQP